MSTGNIGEIMIGINVDIQRTDGRVHSAIISGINAESRSVTVEWYEKGEAKGKEIEFEAIYQLNPSLQPNQLNDENSRPTREPPRNNQSSVQNSKNYGTSTRHRNIPPASIPVSRSRISVRPSALPSHQPANAAPPPQPPPAPAPAPAMEDSSPEESPTPEPFRPPPAPLQEPPAKKLVESGRRRASTSSVFEETFSRFQHRGSLQQLAAPPPPPPVNNVPANAALAARGASRKSTCLSEIEKIQKRREERRAAQKAVREQPEFDPSNPNYDFLMMIREYQEKLDYRPITNTDAIAEHRICVCVRKRPLNKKELGRKEIVVLTIPNKEDVVVHEPKLKVDLTKYLENQTFRFDYAFDELADNEIVYRYTAKPLVECIFEAGMATCFAYGQTGSGKTHTMGGEFSGRGQQDCSKGIYALAARDVFKLLNTKYKKENLIVEAAFFEIYSGKVFDLLNKKQKLRVLEDAKSQVQVVGLKEEPVERVDDVLRLLQAGNTVRTSGQTSANQHSSRSHAVFQIILKKRQTRKLHGKFSLIDLAGNERGADTSSSDRITRMEGAEINKSLLALKECIRALGRKGAHLPFRASKLTQVLRDSFIGDKSRTCMIAMVSPGMSCCEHTLNTLRYADRVKELAPNGPTAAERRDAMMEGPDMPSPDDSTLTSDAGDFRLDEDLLANEEDDLKMLRSANEDEVSEDLLTFHNVINQCEKLEEEVNDEHKQIIDIMADWTRDHKKLYSISNDVDYDLENYASRLETMLTQQLEKLNSLRTKVVVWREEMREEEEISSKIKQMKQAGGGRQK